MQEIEQIKKYLSDREWRISSGILYKIKDKDGNLVPYKPNESQLYLHDSQWYRNLILKARQLGFSTDIDIQAIDYALFNSNVTVGIIAHDLDSVKSIFDDKVKVARENLPERLKSQYTIDLNNANQIKFSNGSTIKVGTSFRSGTLQFLHISEFGKICAKYPHKAKEIVSGAIEAVSKDGFIFIESTAEGNEGYFYDYCKTAKALEEMGADLTQLDYKLHFFPRWKDDKYTLEDIWVKINSEMENYFYMLEDKHGIKLTEGQKKWYIKKKEVLKNDMGREYPSYMEEAFEVAIEGAYYEKEMGLVRKQLRITDIPYNHQKPVYSVRDLGGFGGGDEMAVIFYQKNGDWIDIIDYEEFTGYSIEDSWNNIIKPKGYNILEDWFPHDAKRTESNGKSISENAWDVGIPVRQLEIGSITAGINSARSIFHKVRFDEKKTSKLVKALSNYRREWDDKLGQYKDKPLHNWASHGADCFRYMSVSYEDEKPTKESEYKQAINPITGQRLDKGNSREDYYKKLGIKM